MRRCVTTAAVLAALLGLLVACGDAGGTAGDPGAGDPGTDDDPEATGSPDGDWRLVSGTGPAGEVVLDGDVEVSLYVDGSSWGGQVCNTYGAQDVHVDGSSVSFDGVFRTEMACLDDGVMAAEDAYLAAFEQVDAFTHDGDALILTGPDTELVYARAAEPEAAPLVGTVWQLDTLIEGAGPDGAATTPLTDDLVLELRDDGTMVAGTGCNGLSGTYELDGDHLVVEGGSDDASCGEGVDRQERHVVEVIESGPEVVLDGQRLRLLATDGRALGYHAGE